MMNSDQSQQSGANNPTQRLYVANLGFLDDQTPEDWLRAAFSHYGEIEKIYVMHDRKSANGRLSAFVTMADRFQAERARQVMNKSPCPDKDPRGITCRFADVRAQKPQNQSGFSGYGTNKQWANNPNSNYSQPAYFNSSDQPRAQQTSYQQPASTSYNQQQSTSSSPSATGSVINSKGLQWFEATDPTSGKTYFYTSDGQTTWTRPEEDKAAAPQSDSTYTASVRTTGY